MKDIDLYDAYNIVYIKVRKLYYPGKFVFNTEMNVQIEYNWIGVDSSDSSGIVRNYVPADNDPDKYVYTTVNNGNPPETIDFTEEWYNDAVAHQFETEDSSFNEIENTDSKKPHLFFHYSNFPYMDPSIYDSSAGDSSTATDYDSIMHRIYNTGLRKWAYSINNSPIEVYSFGDSSVYYHSIEVSDQLFPQQNRIIPITIRPMYVQGFTLKLKYLNEDRVPEIYYTLPPNTTEIKTKFGASLFINNFNALKDLKMRFVIKRGTYTQKWTKIRWVLLQNGNTVLYGSSYGSGNYEDWFATDYEYTNIEICGVLDGGDIEPNEHRFIKDLDQNYEL